MRVVVHVGAHKTGTSLVQKYFRNNPDLTETLRIGFLNRTDGERLIGWGHHVHSGAHRLRARFDEELARLPAATFVSHENSLDRPFIHGRPGLYPEAFEAADALSATCEGLDTTVVFYVRPMADFVESYYLQTVHEGAWHSFEEWYDGLDAGPLRWEPVVAALEKAFGVDRVVIGDFTEISHGQNEFLRRFILRSGLPMPTTVAYRPVRNASISARGLEMALRLNPLVANEDERRAVRKFLQANFSNQHERRARPMPDDVRHALARDTAEEYAWLTARAEASLRSAARR